jgi:fimbrial isopeptide formation D2 family protein
MFWPAGDISSLLSLSGNSLSAGTNLIDLQTNSALTIVIGGGLNFSVNPNQAVTNSTLIRWSSLFASPTNLSVYNPNATCRSGGTNVPAAGVNDITNNTILNNYAAASGGAKWSTTTPSFAAGAVTTPGSSANNQAPIGQLVNYTFALTVPQGVTPGAQIVDTLASNLTFVAVANVAVAGTLSTANTISTGTNSANVTIANINGGIGNRVTFTLGAITNTDTSNSATDTLAITFQAVVLDVLGNRASVVLTNGAIFTDTSGDSSSVTFSNVSVIEPTLYVSELVSPNNVAYSTNLAGLQAGNPVYYRIGVSNVLGTTAYNLWLSNSLPANLTNAQVLSAQLTGQVLTNNVLAGSDISSLLSLSGNSLSAGTNLIDLQTNSALTIVIGGGLNFSVNPNQAVTNSTLIRWSSLFASPTNLSVYNPNANARTGGSDVPASGVNDSTNNAVLNNYAATSGGVKWTVGSPTFAAALSFTSVTTPGNNGTNQAAIGGVATYSLTVTVPKGVTPGAQIVDSLHPGMAFVGLAGLTIPAGVGCASTNVAVGNINGGTGNQVTFTLGNITDLNTNGAQADTVVIQYQAVVLDVPGNRAGTSLTNGAIYTDTSGDTLSAASGNVTVVEPALYVRELVSPDNVSYNTSLSGLQSGGSVYYQVVVTNRGDLPGTTAYNLWLSNSLPANFVGAQVISAQLSGGGQVFTNNVPAGSDISSLLSLSGNSLTAGTNLIDLQTNSALSIVIGGTLNFTVNPNQSAANGTLIRWSSLFGSPTNLSVYNTNANARTGGSDAPATGVNDSTNNVTLNNYAATSASASWFGAAALALNTNALFFTSQFQSTNTLAPQNVVLSNAGMLMLHLTNNTAYSQGASNWLTVTPNSGALAGQSSMSLTGAVATLSLPAGIYYATNTVVPVEASPQVWTVQLTVNLAAQAINFTAIANQSSTNTVTANATASSGLAVSFAVISGPAQLVGNQLSFTGAGSVSVAASQAGNSNYLAAVSVTNTFLVNAAAQAPLVFAPTPTQVYNTTNLLSASGGSGAGLFSYAVVSGPGIIVNTNGLWVTNGIGQINVSATKAGDAFYSSMTATGLVNAAKAAQAISFTAIASQSSSNTVTANATASSGLAVSFALISGPAQLVGNQLSFTGTGSVSVAASQAGNSNYLAAVSVTNTFLVNATAQAPLVFVPTATQVYNTTNLLSASGGSGTGAFSYAVVTGPGKIVTTNGLWVTNGTGQINVSATKAGDALYSSMTVTGLVNAAKAAQVINFTAIASQSTTNTVTANATASSGLTVSFAVISGPAQLVGNQLSFTGAGSVSVAASQAGNSNYLAAVSVTNTFLVNGATQAPLVFVPTATQVYNTTNLLSASGGSGTGAFSYAVVSGPGIIVNTNGLWVTNGTGQIIVSATKAGDASYSSLTVTGLVNAAQAAQTISFTAIANQSSTNTVTANATASSGLAVSFARDLGSGAARGQSVKLYRRRFGECGGLPGGQLQLSGSLVGDQHLAGECYYAGATGVCSNQYPSLQHHEFAERQRRVGHGSVQLRGSQRTGHYCQHQRTLGDQRHGPNHCQRHQGG